MISKSVLTVQTVSANTKFATNVSFCGRKDNITLWLKITHHIFAHKLPDEEKSKAASLAAFNFHSIKIQLAIYFN